MIPADHAVILACLLFSIGLAGALTRRNLIMIFVSVELMLNAVNLNLIALGRRVYEGSNPESADAVALFVILLAACEVAVGLGILLALHRHDRALFVEELSTIQEPAP